LRIPAPAGIRIYKLYEGSTCYSFKQKGFSVYNLITHYLCSFNQSGHMSKIYKFNRTFYTVLLAILFCSPIASAQNPIPNSDFENWSGGEPENWSTINRTLLGTTFTAVTRDNTNPQQGSSCIKLETITESVFIIGPVTVPGLITLGEIILDIENQTATVDGGVPVTGYPESLKGWFRYLPATGDSCVIGMGLSRWNGTSRDTIAYDYLSFGGQHPDWQMFTLPLNYLIQAQPDTMNVIFLSSDALNGSILEGSKLWLDNLWIEFNTTSVGSPVDETPIAIVSINNGRALRISGDDHSGELQLYNLNGALLLNAQVENALHDRQIPLPALPPGIYAARYISFSGAVCVQKVLVSR
jgi:hypothetical protein